MSARSTNLRPIKVTYVTNSLGVGGAERMLCDLAIRLDPARFQVEVVCLYKAGTFTALLEPANVPVRVLGLDRRYVPRNWLMTRRALREADPDVVHTHLPASNWYALPAAYLGRIPARISHLQNVYPQWSAKARALDRATRACASVSVACSNLVRDFARDLGYRDEKLRVIPNGVDTVRFENLPDRVASRRKLGLPGRVPILISVASLYEQKGHRYLLEAMTRVHREHPEAQLLLVGGAEQTRTEALQSTVESLGVGDAVRFLGKRRDVPELLAASDLFVMPSLWEGFPLALLEAGAAALPVVATPVGGVVDVVEDGVTGVLVPPRNPDRLAEALASMLREPSRMQQLGEAAWRRVNERFSLERIAGQFEDLYVELLSARRRFPPISK